MLYIVVIYTVYIHIECWLKKIIVIKNGSCFPPKWKNTPSTTLANSGKHKDFLKCQQVKSAIDIMFVFFLILL